MFMINTWCQNVKASLIADKRYRKVNLQNPVSRLEKLRQSTAEMKIFEYELADIVNWLGQHKIPIELQSLLWDIRKFINEVSIMGDSQDYRKVRQCYNAIAAYCGEIEVKNGKQLTHGKRIIRRKNT